MKLIYEPNPKHKEPWQRGRKGTLCPHDKELDPSEMLKDSVLIGKKRYATFEGIAYAAQCDGRCWHGYPEAWVNVPESVRRQWEKEGKVSKKMVRKHWKKVDLEDPS